DLGHLQVEQDDVGPAGVLVLAPPVEVVEGLLAVTHPLHLQPQVVVGGLQGTGGEEQVILVVLGDENADRLQRAASNWVGPRRTNEPGNRTTNRAPGWASETVTCPPHWSTILRHTAKPMPVPALAPSGGSSRSNTPKTLSRYPSGIPLPSSATDTRTAPPGCSSARTVTVTSSRPECTSAFSTRLVNSCRARTGFIATLGRPSIRKVAAG